MSNYPPTEEEVNSQGNPDYCKPPWETKPLTLEEAIDILKDPKIPNITIGEKFKLSKRTAQFVKDNHSLISKQKPATPEVYKPRSYIPRDEDNNPASPEQAGW